MSIDTTNMIDIEQLSSAPMEHVEELVQLAGEARSFLESHGWCKRILKGFLDRGWGYMMAVFYFIIEPMQEDIPDDIWVIVGDLPPACIYVGDNPNGACAIDGYVSEMQKWIDSTMSGRSVAELIPVNTPATEENAQMLRKRIDVIREEILKALKNEVEAGVAELNEQD